MIKKEAKKGNKEDPSSSFAFEIEERVAFGNSVQYKNNNELMLGLPVDESDIQNLKEVQGL